MMSDAIAEDEAPKGSTSSLQTDRRVLVATIGDPVETRKYLKNITTYAVSTAYHTYSNGECEIVKHTSEVRRRFSDFLWLREALMTRFPGLWLPQMAEKKAIGRDKAFIKQRTKDLSRFLNWVLMNQDCSGDSTVHKFLHTPFGKGWDKTKQEILNVEKTYRDPKSPLFGTLSKQHKSNPNISSWYRNVNSLSDHDESEKAMTLCQGILGKLTQVSRKQHLIGKQLASSSEQYTRAVKGLSDAVASLADVVSRDEAAFPVDESKKDKFMSPLVETFDQWKATEDNTHDTINLFWSVAPKNEIMQTLSLRENFGSQYQKILAVQKQLAAAKAKIDTNLEKYKTKGKTAKVTQLTKDLTDINKKIQLAEKLRSRECKALLDLEIKRYSSWRTVDLRLRVAEFASLQLASAVNRREHWKKLLDKMTDDGEAISREPLSSKVLPFRVGDESDYPGMPSDSKVAEVIAAAAKAAAAKTEVVETEGEAPTVEVSSASMEVDETEHDGDESEIDGAKTTEESGNEGKEDENGIDEEQVVDEATLVEEEEVEDNDNATEETELEKEETENDVNFSTDPANNMLFDSENENEEEAEEDPEPALEAEPEPEPEPEPEEAQEEIPTEETPVHSEQVQPEPSSPPVPGEGPPPIPNADVPDEEADEFDEELL